MIYLFPTIFSYLNDLAIKLRDINIYSHALIQILVYEMEGGRLEF